ncbi:MAG: antiterminator LoaP [Termitinemataceae bacterium]|nr:MAG: antiterminator LoaP [Termitinemataceae bacterium]
MKYYAAHVKTGSEEKIKKLFFALYPNAKIKIFFPKRQINERHNGTIVLKELSIFSGYIFIETALDENIFLYQKDFRKIDGFYKFLKSNTDIQELAGRDLEIVLYFIKQNSSLAKISKVTFDNNDKIVVVSGALSGLEGNIIKINKRKGRAKIKLKLYEESFTIDLGFEILEHL